MATETSRASMPAREKYLGTALMCRSDLARYGEIIEELQNYFTKVNDNYPKDMMEAIFLLMNYKQTHSKEPA